MKFDVNELSRTTRTVRIEIPVDKVDQEIREMYDELRQKVAIKGFRPGRTPDSVIRMRFGKDIRLDVGSKLIEESYKDFLEQSGIEPVDNPEFKEWQVNENEPFVYEFTIEVIPDFHISNYEGVEINVTKPDVTEDEIQEGLFKIRDGNITFEVADQRPVQKGDRVFGKVRLMTDGNPLPGWNNRSIELDVGSGKFFPGSGIEDQFIGAEVGKESEWTIQIPMDYEYYSALKGKAVTVNLLVSEIKTPVLPEINDELAQDLGLENLDQLKLKIKEDIFGTKNSQQEHLINSLILDQIWKNNPFDLPEKLVKEEARIMLDSWIGPMKDSDEDESGRGAEIKQHRENLMISITPSAEKIVRERMILTRIAELERIEATTEEVDAEFEKELEESGEDRDQLKDKWYEYRIFGEVRKQIARQKAMQCLRQTAKINVLDPVPVDPNQNPVSE